MMKSKLLLYQASGFFTQGKMKKRRKNQAQINLKKKKRLIEKSDFR